MKFCNELRMDGCSIAMKHIILNIYIFSSGRYLCRLWRKKLYSFKYVYLPCALPPSLVYPFRPFYIIFSFKIVCRYSIDNAQSDSSPYNNRKYHESTLPPPPPWTNHHKFTTALYLLFLCHVLTYLVYLFLFHHKLLWLSVYMQVLWWWWCVRKDNERTS